MNNSKLERKQKKCIAECKHCGGKGCGKCQSKANRYQKYHDANIPTFFWDESISKFGGNKIFKNKIREVASDLDGMYDSGKSLILVGGLGTGKTYMSCCMLKLATIKGYSCWYSSMMEVVNKIVSEKDNSFISKIMNSDFLVLDEFDSRWIFPSENAERMFSSNMEYIIRNRFQNQLPTIICSNTSNVDSVLKDFYGEAFSSLKTKYAEVVYVAGGDLRRKHA